MLHGLEAQDLLFRAQSGLGAESGLPSVSRRRLHGLQFIVLRHQLPHDGLNLVLHERWRRRRGQQGIVIPDWQP